MRPPESRTVYSTDPSWTPPCKKCGEPTGRCRCNAPQSSSPVSQQTLKVRLDRAGRGGKAVTVVEGAQGGPETLGELLRSLKTGCGAGGTLKDRVIEIQGDQRDRVAALLEKRGYRVKRAGG